MWCKQTTHGESFMKPQWNGPHKTVLVCVHTDTQQSSICVLHYWEMQLQTLITMISVMVILVQWVQLQRNKRETWCRHAVLSISTYICSYIVYCTYYHPMVHSLTKLCNLSRYTDSPITRSVGPSKYKHPYNFPMYMYVRTCIQHCIPDYFWSTLHVV